MFNRIAMHVCHCVTALLLTMVTGQVHALSLVIDAPTEIQAGQTLTLQTQVQTDSPSSITLQFKDQTQTLAANLTWLEAETYARPQSVILNEQASDGKVVQSQKKYDAAVTIPFPQNGKTYSIWFRSRGSSYCLKGSDFENGKNSREIQWNWSRNQDWQWNYFKPVSQDKVGKVFMLMKGPGNVGEIDAVILTTDQNYKPQNTLQSAPNVFRWQTLPSTVGTFDLSITATQDSNTVTATHQVNITAPKQVINQTPKPMVQITDAVAIDLSAITLPWDQNKTAMQINGEQLDSVFAKEQYGLTITKPNGLIALQCKQFMDLPQAVTIPINQKAAGLAFVHTQYMQRDPFHKVAQYRVDYTDGSSQDIMLQEEVNIAGSLRPASATEAQYLKTIGIDGVDYHLFLFPWINPHPDKTIKQVVFTNQINRENKEENTTLGFNVADATSQILLSLNLIKDAASALALQKQCTDPQLKVSHAAYATIDFSQVQGSISRGVFSTNETGTLSGKDERFDEYKKLIDKMGCNNLRLHSGFRLQTIFPTPDTDGDFTALDERIAALKDGMPDRDIMMCFNRVPDYINPSVEADRKVFADLCAKVVKHLNAKPQTHVRYWEIYNEPFSKVIPEDRGHWKMYNLTAKAMKQVDPNIIIGGYAPCWPILNAMRDFYAYCHENVDFISWHKYPTGNSETPTEYLMKNTGQFGTDVQNVRKIINDITPGKKVELALTEYHVNFNWKPHDPRQATNVGSTWMASVIYHLLLNDMDIAQSWHSRSGGTFGMMSKSLEVRPTGQLLYILNQHMNGSRVQSRSDNPWVEVLGFVTKEGKQGLLIINKSDSAQSLSMQLLHANLPDSDAFEANANCHRIGPKGYSVSDQWLTATPQMELLPYEVQLIVTR